MADAGAPAADPQATAVTNVGSAFGAGASGNTSGLSPAQTAAIQNVQQQFAPAKPPADTTPPKPLTTTSSDTANQYIADNQQKIGQAQAGGAFMDPSGATRYSNGSYASAPSDATQDPTTGMWMSGGKMYASPPDSGITDPIDQQISDQIKSMQSRFDATAVAGIDLIKQQYDSLSKQQADINMRSEASLNQTLLMGGSQRYAQVSSTGQMQAMMTYGLDQISNLHLKEQAALQSAHEAMLNGDMKFADQKMQQYQKAQATRQAAAQSLADKLQKQYDQVVADKKQASKDQAIGSIMSSGITDPAEIMKQLGTQGITATAKDVADSINNLNPDAKAVAQIMADAAKNGATKDILSSIGKTRSVAEAISAAGSYMQDPSSAAGQYAAYVQHAQAAGQTPLSYTAWDNKITNTQAYNKAYSTAAGAAAGQASVLPDTSNPQPFGGDATGNSILAHTGLSIAAFNYLTQGTASMSRMTAGQRNKIMNEAETWLNKNGVDISTFQSQYNAYNDTLKKNIERANQTKIMAGEVSGSADALLSVLQPTKANSFNPFVGVSKLGNLKAANVLDLMAGKEVNSEFAQKYSFQIQAMANDLAGYFAASRGATSPEDSDKRDAANVIANGMNSTSVQAFRDSINANEQKVAGVVNNAVVNSQKQVWNLFGVGDQYKNPTNTTDQVMQDETAAENKIGTFYQASPQNKKLIDDIHAQFPDMSAQEVTQKLGI